MITEDPDCQNINKMPGFKIKHLSNIRIALMVKRSIYIGAALPEPLECEKQCATSVPHPSVVGGGAVLKVKLAMLICH